MTNLDIIKEKWEFGVQKVFGYFFSSMEEVVQELNERERLLIVREQKLEEALLEVESLIEDIKATNPSLKHKAIPTYVSQGVRFVKVDDLPPRDAQVLATLERLSHEDPEGRTVVSTPNKDIAIAASTDGTTVTRGSLSAALSRLSHKGLIEVVAFSGRGYPRNIFLKAKISYE